MKGLRPPDGISTAKSQELLGPLSVRLGSLIPTHRALRVPDVSFAPGCLNKGVFLMTNHSASWPPRLTAWMWRGSLAAIVVMPLLLAGLFGQLPWQTDAAPSSFNANQAPGSGVAAAIVPVSSPTSVVEPSATISVSSTPIPTEVALPATPTPAVRTAHVFPPGSVVSATANLNQRASSSTAAPVLTV